MKLYHMQHINLICLPFAGGNKHSLGFLKRHLPGNIQVHFFEYPGHGGRIKETCFTELERIVDDIYGHVLPLVTTPYAIYGHSMGARIAHLLTVKLILAGFTPPVHLFISSANAPVVEKEDTCYHLPRHSFLDKVKALGGMPDEVFRNADLMDFFEPILRADFTALETHRYTYRTPMDIPLTVMMGNSEALKEPDALLWQQETTCPIRLYKFPGDHFYFYKNEKAVADVFARTLY